MPYCWGSVETIVCCVMRNAHSPGVCRMSAEEELRETAPPDDAFLSVFYIRLLCVLYDCDYYCLLVVDYCGGDVVDVVVVVVELEMEGGNAVEMIIGFGGKEAVRKVNLGNMVGLSSGYIYIEVLYMFIYI